MNKLIKQARDLFKDAGFDHAICGGYALDLFAGRQLRKHGDLDLCFYQQDMPQVLQYLLDRNWPIYGREGGWDELRAKQFIFYNITNASDPELKDFGFWAVKPGGWMEMIPLPRASAHTFLYKNHGFKDDEFTFIELAFNCKEDDEYVLLANPRITRHISKAILYADGVPYLAPEITLFFKTDEWSATNAYLRPKMITDFQAVMPLMNDEQRAWLMTAINHAYGGHTPWLDEALMGVAYPEGCVV